MTNIAKDELSRSWFMVGNAMSPIGLFLYFKHGKQYRNRVKKALTSAMIGVPMALVMGYMINAHLLK